MSSAPPEIPIAKKTYLSASSDDNSSDEEEAVLNAGKTVDIQSNGTANEKKPEIKIGSKVFTLNTLFLGKSMASDNINMHYSDKNDQNEVACYVGIHQWHENYFGVGLAVEIKGRYTQQVCHFLRNTYIFYV